MRILHIVGTISPAAGGPTEVIRMLVRYAPPGDSAELVTLDDPDAPFLAELDFPVRALGSSKPGSKKMAWYSPKLIPWLKENRHRFDGIIVHGLWEFTGLAVSLAHGRTPYVVFPHGMLDPYFKRRHPAKHLKKWLYWLLAEYWTLRRATRVLFTTETERTLAAHSFWLHRWNPLVVALGTEPPPTDTPRLLAAFYERCPELEGKRFLLFLGRIDPKKGCDILMRAFSLMAVFHQEIDLVMAGPDPKNWRAELESILNTFPKTVASGNFGAPNVSHRVHWPGMLQGDAKWGAFAACEAFILTSHQENFGIAVVEALASGRPVLISDQINIASDVRDDGCGLVQPDTYDGALSLIKWWLGCSPDQRAEMEQRALTTFARRYDMHKNAATILGVFDNLKEAR